MQETFMHDYADGFHLVGSLDISVVASELQRLSEGLKRHLYSSTFKA